MGRVTYPLIWNTVKIKCNSECKTQCLAYGKRSKKCCQWSLVLLLFIVSADIHLPIRDFSIWCIIQRMMAIVRQNCAKDRSAFSITSFHWEGDSLLTPFKCPAPCFLIFPFLIKAPFKEGPKIYPYRGLGELRTFEVLPLKRSLTSYQRSNTGLMRWQAAGSSWRNLFASVTFSCLLAMSPPSGNG